MKLIRYCHSQVISQVPWLIRIPSLLALVTKLIMNYMYTAVSVIPFIKEVVTVKAGQV